MQGDGCFCYFCREDDAHGVEVEEVWLDHFAFLAGLESAVQLFDDEVDGLLDSLEAFSLVDLFDGSSDLFDVFDGGEENQDVGLLVVIVDVGLPSDVVEDDFEVRGGVLDQRGFEVGEVGVVDLHIERGRDCFDELVVEVVAFFGEVLLEQLRVQRGGGHDELLLRLRVAEQVPQDREDYHALLLELVRLVDHEHLKEVQEVLSFFDHLSLEFVLDLDAATSLM